MNATSTHKHMAAPTGLSGLSIRTTKRHEVVKHVDANMRKLEKETWVHGHISLYTFSKIKEKY